MRFDRIDIEGGRHATCFDIRFRGIRRDCVPAGTNKGGGLAATERANHHAVSGRDRRRYRCPIVRGAFDEPLGQAGGGRDKPGSDGILAVTAFLGARDEHTILLTNGGPLTSNPFKHDKLPYDPINDFVPISSAADALVAVSAPTSLQVDSLASFVKYARAHSGRLNWGATPGALDYIVPGFLKRAGLDMTHVPYREIAPALQDLAEARLHLYASALVTQLPAVHTGKVRVLVVTNRERTNLVPETPTAREAGFADLEFEAFLGFFGPPGMQKELQERISAGIREFGGDAALAARLSAAGLRLRTNTPTELSEIVERERRKVAELARTADQTPK